MMTRLPPKPSTGKDVHGRRLQRKRQLIPTAVSQHPPPNAPVSLPNLQIPTEFQLTPCCLARDGNDASRWSLKPEIGNTERSLARHCHRKPPPPRPGKLAN